MTAPVRWTRRGRRARDVAFVVAVLITAKLFDALMWMLPPGVWSR